MKLLIVQDEKDLNEITVKELMINGYIVDSCFDGEEAYSYLSLGEYDGAILDVMLPKLDGFEVLEKIRDQAKKKSRDIRDFFLSNITAVEEFF